MTRRLRTILGGALAAYVAAVLLITLWPTAIDKPVSTEIREVITTARDAGAPSGFDYNFLEAGSNVLLFLPLGVLVALLLAPRLWWGAPLLGLALSLTIELVQWVALPDRDATAFDVMWNTLGALIGAALVVASRRVAAVRSLRAA